MELSTLFRRKSIAQIQHDAEQGFSDAEAATTQGEPHLKRALGVVDLTALGIAAIIGAGIFSTIGNAAHDGGPAVVFLFIFTAIACAFSAYCYAEFASMIPIAGSAYTYSYASFGELIAWIIGWDLIIEYAIGNITVAISWADYFTGLLSGYNIKIPDYLTMDYLSASRGFQKVTELLAQGNTIDQIKALDSIQIKNVTVTGDAALKAFHAWTSAPQIGGLHIICNLPALAIVFIITALVYIGIQESKRASNIMVALKLAVVLLVIVLGAFYVKPANWSPFAPNGISGVLKGVSAVFFAYIGFDAISTTAEECRNPQKDLPRGMILSLIICTILYIAVALVLTGMVSYKNLQVGDPLAFVFGANGANINWISGVIAVSALIAMATVLLVFQLGQPRIWMSMSRDGLLPPIFSSIHPRFKTPWFSTIVTGIVVAVPSLFMNLTEVTDLTSIGTLFAFILVCGGVLILDQRASDYKRGFRTPYINSQFIVPALYLIAWLVALLKFRDETKAFFTFGSWDVDQHKIPMLGYILLSTVLTYFCFRRKLSLVPVLGLLTCGYLMTQLEILSWVRFIIWLTVGLCLYFTYGFRHSKLNAERVNRES